MKPFSFTLCETNCLQHHKHFQVTTKVMKASKHVFIFRQNSRSSVLFKVNRKLVRFPTARVYCGDHLYFREQSTQGHFLLPQFHCNGISSVMEIWNDQFSTYVYDFFEIIYHPNYGSAGGKFWLAFEGEYNSLIIRT